MHGLVVCRRSTKDLVSVAALITAVVTITLFTGTALPAAQPSQSSWVGKSVLPKSAQFQVESEGKPVQLSRWPTIYRVVEAKGSSLRLQAGVFSGWASQEQVVPVEKAAGFFTDYIRANPRDVFGYAMRALVWANVRREPNRALADYNQAIQLDPTDVTLFVERGEVRLAMRDFDKAFNDYDEAIRISPKFIPAHFARSGAWLVKGEYDRAIAGFNEAIKLDASVFLLYFGRGSAWFKKAEYDKAIADQTEAIRLNPKFPQAYVQRAMAWYAKDDLQSALADFNQAIKLEPEDIVAHNQRGLVWHDLKQYDSAIADFSEVIRIAPSNPVPHRNRGRSWQAKMNYEKAIADESEAIRLDPKFGAAYADRAVCYSRRREWGKALADYDAVVRFEPAMARGYNGRAWIWATCPEVKYREGKRAVESATKACELTAWKEPNCIDTLAAAHAESGDFDAAAKSESKAIELLTDQVKKQEYRERLVLYQARKPYRTTSP